jgi:hypothetical protein
MYTLVRRVRLREGILAEGPAFLISLLCAETFYKFHSFTLECVCFLATWLAVSSALALAIRRVSREPEVAEGDRS